MSRPRPLTTPDYWDKKRICVSPTPVYIFHRLFARLLPRQEGMRLMELGCGGGNFLLYFGREFQYIVSGIDWCPGLDELKTVLEREGVKVGRLVEADFLNYHSDEEFDVVASFGFIEHFDDSVRIVRRQLKMVRPGGYAIIEVPHFKGIQGFLRRIIDSKDFHRHNIELMSPTRVRRIVESEGFHILYCDYFKTFRFWAGDSFFSKFVATLSERIEITLRILRMDNIPNRPFSPYVVCIARKERHEHPQA